MILADRPTLLGELERLAPGATTLDLPLSKISRWRIGGTADLVVSPRNLDELRRVRRWIHDRGLPSVIIGATSNLLFADEGLRAICLRIGPEFAGVRFDGGRIVAGPGVWVPGLARRCQQAGLTGVEHICGIPGTLGGLVCMNGGSQRKGIGDVVVSVSSVDAQGELRVRDRVGCGFAYRRSVFQENGEVVAEVVLELPPATDPLARHREMLSILRDRRRKFPQKQPNCGSVFVSNPAMYADYGPPGAIIEKLGFKGQREGAALVSPRHANFIVNEGDAAARDVIRLIRRIKTAVHRDTGYSMEIEARYVTPEGAVISPDEAPVH